MTLSIDYVDVPPYTEKCISLMVGNTFAVCGEEFLRKMRYTFLRRYIKMDQIKIGKFIAALRKEKCLTQEQLGEKLGVTKQNHFPLGERQLYARC